MPDDSALSLIPEIIPDRLADILERHAKEQSTTIRDLMAEVCIDGLKAKRVVILNGQAIETELPDHSTRMKAYEMAGKTMGELADGQTVIHDNRSINYKVTTETSKEKMKILQELRGTRQIADNTQANQSHNSNDTNGL